jgi:hypothetical protein
LKPKKATRKKKVSEEKEKIKIMKVAKKKSVKE